MIVAMLYSKPELVAMAVRIAREFNLDPALICAHCDVRSHWNSGFRVLVSSSVPLSLNPVEAENRSTLWGLMAISGESASNVRTVQDAKLQLQSLSELLDPLQNLRFGSRC